MSGIMGHTRIIIGGGGTGGHIFPAISIANALRRMDPSVEILFVGAVGRMEMTRVPEAGYEIKGLPVAGFIRKKYSPENLIVVWKLLKSMLLARKIIRDFRPQIVVGVGGYASGPVLRQAQHMGIPTVIQEQNSYAGVTNRLLAAKAKKICVAYEGMEKYFPAEKIIKTGNPVRHTFDNLTDIHDEAISFYGLDKTKPVILVLGESLGAGTINNSLSSGIGQISDAGVQLLWQTGGLYFDRMRVIAEKAALPGIHVMGFINRMDLAYSASDIIISRAGAGTISELELVGKPVILVPSPNVAEDHQTHNAMALVNKNAAILISDAEADNRLIGEALALINDGEKCRELSHNIMKLADRNSDETIAGEILKLIKR